MTVVWSGSSRASLHDMFTSPRDLLLWQTRGSSLADAAPGSGFPTCRELRTQDFDRRRTRVKARRDAARKAGHCPKCIKRPSRAGRVLCAVCGAASAARGRRRRR